MSTVYIRQDVVLVDSPEGYQHLWRKALVFLSSITNSASQRGPLEAETAPSTATATTAPQPQGAPLEAETAQSTATAATAPQPQGADERVSPASVQSRGMLLEDGEAYEYVMHADDDSFLRLDLLLPFLATCPRSRFYWGYIWDGTGNRVTAPIRNPQNKSHMPASQYALDFYPPFASGCGFILSWDLVVELTKQALPDYSLLDPPFGIHLCGGPSWCVISDDAGGPVTPVHDERALEHAEKVKSGNGEDVASKSAPEELYNTLVQLGLLRR
eukprot:gene23781-9340_t